ncbi:Sh3 domain-binding glutamic acid-rich-like protein [Plakobranchus ocellatus]|uniref:SH3 domain-binding glutamic acid-rich-like protein n=1 Tax=Plakobranchus ocellatus TaxID=259542 RepID=A0AAV3Y1P7_9GAST|nr:Sh3 domain-binding glutamic acid-rich-like protein [Plakobranchus ocellatus]
MSANIVVYVSTVSSSIELKKKQQKIEAVLSGKKIAYTAIDVAADRENLEKMRQVVGDPTALAPQIVNGDVYCGNFEAFDEAVENEEIEQFLKL